MSLVFASICPHPPIIIPTIGRSDDLKQVSKTIEGMKQLARIFADSKPESIILISPHAIIDPDSFVISNSPNLKGNFRHFGDLKTEFIFKSDLELIEKIKKECNRKEIPLKLAEIEELDHGSLVPLHYLIKESPNPLYYSGKATPNIKLVSMAVSYLDVKTHFEFGKILQQISKEQETKIGIIASGDLSHKLSHGSPAGFSPKGKEFDEAIVRLLKLRKAEEILKLDPSLIKKAGECGYLPIVILLGLLDGLNWQPEILSYEGPFGVGYLVANFKL